MFKDKVVLVTGGSRGIGAEICKMFARHNAKVYINYFSNEERALALKKEIERQNGNAECICGNVADQQNVYAIFKELAKKEKKLDVLINNAGIKNDSLMAVMKTADWNNVIQVNLSGAFYCSKAAVRLMLSSGAGNIINIASISGITNNYGQANYSAAKAGLISLTKTMAKELGQFNIRVNAIAPGLIETEMLKSMKDEAVSKIVSSTPLGRVGHVTEVSQAVKFLASDDASYINGHCLVIDGGLSC
ncbi:MAG: 3-oxoacyl-ACP reductase FabG [Legionella sp.]|nr:3-oxoacyl-ACP reductase FabG [Legionella sp.]